MSLLPRAGGYYSRKYTPVEESVVFKKKLLLLLNLSRWREAVCIMMLVSDPHITNDGVNKLGRQLAQLFRQDLQV